MRVDGLVPTYTLSTPTADKLGVQRGEMRRPGTPKAVEPPVDVSQGLGVDRVQAPCALRAHGCQALLAQDPQVSGDAGLGDPELLLDDLADRTRRQLPVGEQLKDPPPYGITQHLKRMHRGRISVLTYIRQLL
jgi:hypothetical protein